MTPLIPSTPFSSASTPSAPDFVSTDAAALASHMSHCASTRSRFFGLHSALEFAHSLLLPRMITALVVTVVLVGLVGIV